ncbi:MAG: adaptor protein MecA [Butyribacter sp.]|nr:adaptor protein MecA [bacterium]MDY3853477.1 adaptor protein MecA [Butyribacter sp.]
MEFERIGKNTVQCRMTVEEMNEYGLRIEDFFTNQEKSRDFLEQLVERAEEEIGYEVESGMVSMQLMRMPDDSLVITFSDRAEESINSMLNQIQNLAGQMDTESQEEEDVFQEIGASMEESSHQKENMKEFENNLKNKPADEEYLNHIKEVEQKQKEKLRKKQTAARVFRFNSLNIIEDFVSSLAIEKSIPSRLYKDKDTDMWYLLIKKGKLKLEEYQDVCQLLQEYGVLCSAQPYVEQYCKEHYDCIIGKQALKTIKNYIS